MHKIKAFTMAETIISLLVIGIIAALLIQWLDLNHMQQRELLTRFQIVYTKMENIVSMSAQTSKNHSDWSSDINSLANLSCSDAANQSQCLKRALMSVSSQLKDCPEPDKCFANYNRLQTQLREIFPSLNVDEMTAFTMPGGINILMSYLDGECELEIPVNRSRAGTVEKVQGCGFMITDVNGKKKPNNLLVGEGRTIDRFLMVITKNGLVRSNLLDEIAGCPRGTTYNAEENICEAPFVCPYNMDKMREIEANGNTYRQNTNGDCYEVKCTTGDFPDSENKCPVPCEAADERRHGGLWVSEGGDLPNVWTAKACCVPINTQAELAAINTNATTLGRNYCLESDINFDRNGAGSDPTKGWTPIGTSGTEFTGAFYGNGHRINNFYINRDDLRHVGLFGRGSGNRIENLEINGGEITAGCNSSLYNCNIGGIAGYSGTLSNVINSSNISGSRLNKARLSYTGGVTGSATNITNAVNNGTVNIIIEAGPASDYEYDSYGGGVTAKATTILNAINTGNITNKNTFAAYSLYTAGIIADTVTSKNIINIINSGNIISSNIGHTSAGGGIAYGDDNNNNNNNNIINNGNVTGTSTGSFHRVGGGIAHGGKSNNNIINNGNVTAVTSTGDSNCVGGGIGRNGGSSSNIINNGNVTAVTSTGDSNWVGGGIAYGGKSNNIINNGNVTGTLTGIYHWVGGEIGQTDGELSGLYNLSTVTYPMIGNKHAFATISNAFYLSGSVTGCTTAGNYEGCSEILAADLKKAATYAGLAADTVNWSVVDGFLPTLKAAVMPPQTFRDCRNNPTPYGGCFDVLNTPNAFMPNFGETSPIGNEAQKPYIMWAWKKPATDTSPVEMPVLRWQCKPYRSDGFDCCRPSYATWEPKLPACPALVVPAGADYRAVN